MSDDNFQGKPITEWSVKEANRNMCADYLRTLAKLVEQGACEAFDIGWNLDIRKPEGKMVMGATWLTAPVEAQFLDAVQAYRAAQAQKIVVHDATEQIKDALQDHEPCEGEAKEQCRFCNDKLS